MRAKEMRERDDEELMNLYREAKAGLFKDRLKNATHTLDKTHEIRLARREVARVLTIINERKITDTKAEISSKKKSDKE